MRARYAGSDEPGGLFAVLGLFALLLSVNNGVVASDVHDDSSLRNPGWGPSGRGYEKYSFSRKTDVAFDGVASFCIASGKEVTSADFATMMQKIDAQLLRNKSVTVTAYARSYDVKHSVAVWARVLDANGSVLSFNNMANDMRLRGTSDWTMLKIRLSVPNEAVEFAFGALLVGPGAVLIDSFSIESDGRSIAPHGRDYSHISLGAPRAVGRDHPINLGFEDSLRYSGFDSGVGVSCE